MKDTKHALPSPCRYLPLQQGRFEINAGLARLGKDFFNGEADRQVFQIDRDFPVWRGVKLAARHEQINKYLQVQADFEPVAGAICQYLVHQLVREHPRRFQLQVAADGDPVLDCRLTGERLHFSTDFAQLKSAHALHPDYTSAFDALACQVQEDMAICRGSQGRVCALHLCYPNHWSARDKIGKDFIAVHNPVPGFQRIDRGSRKLLHSLIHQGPFVRFAWGLATDTRLNHHPDPNLDHDLSSWQGRQFDMAKVPLILRIERQTTTGFPELDAFLFTIRTYFRPLRELDGETLAMLRAAIGCMSREILAYKGLEADKETILARLQAD